MAPQKTVRIQNQIPRGRPWWSRAQQHQADLHPQALALTCWPCWPRIARSGLTPKKCNFPRTNPLKVVQFSAFEEEINKSLILAIFCWSAHYWVQNSLPVSSVQWPGKKIMSSCGKGQLSTETNGGFFFSQKNFQDVAHILISSYTISVSIRQMVRKKNCNSLAIGFGILIYFQARFLEKQHSIIFFLGGPIPCLQVSYWIWKCSILGACLQEYWGPFSVFHFFLETDSSSFPTTWGEKGWPDVLRIQAGNSDCPGFWKRSAASLRLCWTLSFCSRCRRSRLELALPQRLILSIRFS